MNTLHAAAGSRRTRTYSSAELQASTARLSRPLHPSADAARGSDVMQTTRLMAPIVHEMRNFLAPMRVSLELLRHSVTGDSGGERALDILKGQTEALSRLVADLLDASRIATGKLTLALRECVLQDVARRTVEMCGPSAQERSQQLVLDCSEAPVRLLADPLRLGQALANLVFNAVRHTPQGGCILVQVGREGAWAQIRVTDEGAGMTSENLGRVFDLYAQAVPAHDGGLGIGLTLVKGIVELHGGRVTAASKGVGQGSTFTMDLPLGLRLGGDSSLGRLSR